MATLKAWLDQVEPIEPEDRDGVLLKLFFAAYADPGAIRAQLLDYRERVQARLATYFEIEAPSTPNPIWRRCPACRACGWGSR